MWYVCLSDVVCVCVCVLHGGHSCLNIVVSLC